MGGWLLAQYSVLNALPEPCIRSERTVKAARTGRGEGQKGKLVQAEAPGVGFGFGFLDFQRGQSLRLRDHVH